MTNMQQTINARELGYRFSNKMIQVTCPNCGKERWVQLSNQKEGRLCRECFCTLILPKLNHPGRNPKPYSLFTGIPQIGDMKFGRELGFKDECHKFIWEPCPICQVPRWIRIDHKTIRCQNCNIQNPKRGIAHPLWKGGQTMQDGYIVILNHAHPNCDINGYVKRCRLILEQTLGYILPREIHIHHMNGIKTDDRPENLMALSPAEHMRLHGIKRGGLSKEKDNA